MDFIVDDGSRPLVEYRPVGEEQGSTCTVDHLCAVCGQLALPAGHATRGDTWEPRHVVSNCRTQFRIRCADCFTNKRKLSGMLLAIEMASFDDYVANHEDLVFEVM